MLLADACSVGIPGGSSRAMWVSKIDGVVICCIQRLSGFGFGFDGIVT